MAWAAKTGAALSNWHEHGFGTLYPIVYAHRDMASAKSEAAFAAKCLGLKPSDCLLDLGCGGGRHLVHLAPRVRYAVGLDFSDVLLALARKDGGHTTLVRGDMRMLPFENAFDAITSFFTSLGYFSREEENERAIAELARALKPGGRFFIDYLNAPHVERTLVPESFRERDGLAIHERRWIDSAARRVNKAVRVTRGADTVGEWRESVRMYTEAEFRALLARNALTVIRAFGGFDGSPLTATQPRMIITGHKEKA